MRLHCCHWVCIRFYLAAFVYVLCIVYMCHLEWMKWVNGGRKQHSFIPGMYGYDDDNGQWHTSQFIHFWWYQYHSVMTVSINHIIDMFNAHAVEAFYGHNGWNLRCTHHWRFIDHHFTIFSMGSATIHMTNITLWVNEQCPHFKCTRETKILEK